LAEWQREVMTSFVAFLVLGLVLSAMLFILFRQVDGRSAAETALQSEMIRGEREAAKAREARHLAAARSAFAEELERKNKELEAFSDSVSHDLRAPLRSIDGFSLLLLEQQGAGLDDKGRDYLQVIRHSAQRMGELIDDLLKLSRVSRAELHRRHMDLSDVVREIVSSLQKADSGRSAEFIIKGGLHITADESLIRIVIENLLGNALKFTSRCANARIEFGSVPSADGQTFYIRDNGAGFSMKYSNKLFRPFQRLHRQSDFPGTGIGLATVQRVIERHGGRVWAESTVGEGAVFFFTVSDAYEEREG
jgi:two-component system, NtrC family, sensor kinase